jgi:hypothetical protein
MKKVLIPLGAVLILAAAAWVFVLSPRSEQRFPVGWRWEVNTLASTIFADTETGQFVDDTPLDEAPPNIAQRVITASAEGAPAGYVTLTDQYTYSDALTGAVQWQQTSTAIVDPLTGRYADAEFAGDYFLFPRNVEQTTYTIRNSTYLGIPLSYVGTESVLGLPTYKFTYADDLNNPLSYPDLPLEDGQAVVCANFELTYWVEPVTGEVVKFREWCGEGDHVVDTATGEQLYALARWGGETSGDDLIRSVGEVHARLTTTQWLTIYLPLALGILGAALIVVGVLPLVTRQQTEPEKALAA